MHVDVPLGVRYNSHDLIHLRSNSIPLGFHPQLNLLTISTSLVH